MTKRDRSIIADLGRFGVMTRDQIIKLHFKGLRNPVSNANAVMLRLYRQGRVERNADFSQYVYFPIKSGASKNTPKLHHYLAIVDVYMDMKNHGKVTQFIVEPKYGKGYAEPDAFAIWKGSPFFIEVQLSRISTKEVMLKVKRYDSLKESRIINHEPWQPTSSIFPTVLLISQTRHVISNNSIKFVQVQKIDDLMPTREIKSEPIKIKI